MRDRGLSRLKARRPDRFLRPWVVLYLENRRRRRIATGGQAAQQPPNAPVNLTATDGSTYVQLNWSDMSANELGFRIYRKADAGSYGLLQTLGANVTSAQDNAVVAPHQYWYYVVAFNAAGESGQSNEAYLQFGST